MEGTTDRSAIERQDDEQGDGGMGGDRPSPDQIGGTRTGDGGTGGDRTDRQDVTGTMTGEQGTDEGSREPAP
jgi:hypothetical protein